MSARQRLPVELAAPAPLGNMSCRPNTAIVHEGDTRARQLVPALRTRLPFRSGGRPRTPAGWLVLAGVPRRQIPPGAQAAQQRLDAVIDAVPGLLALPAVVPLSPGGDLPLTTECPDGLLALALLARQSGGVWLARRTPAVAGLSYTNAVITLLLPPTHHARVMAAVADPGWMDRVLAHASALEASR